MQVAMFTDCYRPIINGVTTAVANLKQGLELQGVGVAILAPDNPGFQETEAGVYRFLSATFPLQPEERVSFPWPLAHFRTLSRFHPRLIHLHTPFNMGWMGIAAARRLKVPMVFTHHTLWEEYVHYIPFINRKLLRRTAIGLDRYFCHQSRAVIAPSSRVAELLREQGVRTPITILPSGVWVEGFKGGDPTWLNTRLNLPPEKRILLFVGRIGKEKGLDLLLKSLPIIRAGHPQAHLVLVGGGPDRERLEETAAQLGVMDQVTFAGYLSGRELINAYASARCFVFSSQTDTQGLVLVEAMSAGTPVVAVRASGTQDTVTHDRDGFLTEADPADLARYVCMILENEALRARLSAGAMEKADSFSVQAQAAKVLEVYNWILDPVGEIPYSRGAGG